MQFTHIPSISLLLLTSFISAVYSDPIHTTNSNPLRHSLHNTPLSTTLSCSSTGAFDLTTLITHSKAPSKKIALAVDAPSPFFPWSYEPICTFHLPSIGSKLCVYTNASFSSDRGISIFTTPKIARKFAKLPPFQNPSFPSLSLKEEGGVKKKSNINKPKSEAPWFTQPLPGKGIGMIAAQELNRGELVTAYTPVLLVYLEEDLSMVEREKMLRVAINQLPPKTREAYLGLGRLYGDAELVVQDVLKANTFEVVVGGVGHLGLVPETSRINHSCGPNSQYYFNAELFTHFVHATRPIAPGEEITISYTNPFSPTSERQEHLQSSFHFTCTCLRCTHPHTSDTLLSKISTLQESLSDWDPPSLSARRGTSDNNKPPHNHPTIKQLKTLLKLYKKAHLTAFMDTAYGHAVLTYSAVGDGREAVRFAGLAMEAVGFSLGTGVEDWRLWEGIFRGGEEGGIEGHWSWRFRV